MSIVQDVLAELRAIPFETLLPPAGVLLFYLFGTRLLVSASSRRPTRILLLVADTVIIPALLITLLVIVGELTDRAFTGRNVIRVLQAALILVAVWLFDRYLALFVWTRRFHRLRGAEAPTLLRNLVTILLFVAAFAVVAVAVFDRAVGGILVSTGVLVGVIGFALQSLLTDLFAGIAMTFDRPFDMGDWVKLPDNTEGEVVQVNWKSTLLKSLNDGIFIVPNSKMSQSVVHNLSRPNRSYATWMMIAIDRRYPPDFVRKRLMEAALSCTKVLKEPPPSVNLADGTGNPLRYSVYVYFGSYLEHFSARSELYLNIYSYLEHAGIETSADKYEVQTEAAPDRTISRPTVYDELRQTDIFAMLSDEQISLLAERSIERTYYPGEVIVREGEKRSDLLIITSGITSIRKRARRGGIEVARLGAGSVIGEMSLLTGAPRSATVTANVITTLIEVPKEALEPIIHQVPAIVEEFGRIIVERQISSEQFTESMRASEKNPAEFIRESIDRFVGSIRTFFRVPKQAPKQSTKQKSGQTPPQSKKEKRKPSRKQAPEQASRESSSNEEQ